MQHVGGVFYSGFHVVGNHENGDAVFPVQLGDQLIQLQLCLGIQPRDRLVQYQHFLSCPQSPCQKHPLLLAAGEFPIAPLCQMRDAQPFHVVQCQLFFLLGIKRAEAAVIQAAGTDDFQHRCGKVPLYCRLLGQIADLVRL